MGQGDFNNLDVGIQTLADLLQRFTNRQSNRMALALSLRFIQQVDLNIPLIRLTAKVILAYQAVKVNRRCVACIKLQVFDFGNAAKLLG